MTPPAEYTFGHAVAAVKNGEPLAQATQKLLSQLTEPERLGLLDGDLDFWSGVRAILNDRYNATPYIHGAVPRLCIPGIKFTDGPRGVVMGNSTAFPVPMARGATWDLSLEQRVGDAIGVEAKAQGANFFGGVCVNLPRHPAWGRIQETYGEDPVLLGNFGVALTQGVQKHVIACVKHYALNSMENARFKVDVNVAEPVLHEVYLAHFRQIVVEGEVGAVMSSYNSVNGEWAGQNKHLLTEILRNQWGFDGLVISDFVFGFRDAALSLKNGLDIEAPFRQQRHRSLPTALQDGNAAWEDVNTSCERILRKQIQFEAHSGDNKPGLEDIFSASHRALAREVAGRSMVLLKNDPVGGSGSPILPLQPRSLKRVAVVGRLADMANTGDKGSSQVFPPHVVTALEGIRAALQTTEVLFAKSLDEAEKLASVVDLVICVVGFTAEDEGEYVVPPLETSPDLQDIIPLPSNDIDMETMAIFQSQTGPETGGDMRPGAGGDRASLELREEDEKLIRAVAALNKQTVVSIVAAGAVIQESWKQDVPAILLSWYSGSEGGHAMADVLLGRLDASGRLPFSIPASTGHLPFFDRDVTHIEYDRWYGQHLLDKLGVRAAYPFGFGLSYTTWEVENARAWRTNKSSDTITVEFHVRNTGHRPGRFIAQVYGLPELDDFPTRVLLGFTPVDLDAGQALKVALPVSLRPVQRWNNGIFINRSEDLSIEVARFAGDRQSAATWINLRESLAGKM